MTDLDALKAVIRADSDARGQTVSKMGYFCAPFRPASGPFSDKVIKVYRGLRDQAALDRLAQCHDDYVAALNQAGVALPDTEFHLLDMDGTRIPVIVQEALPSDSMMRPQMQSASTDETLQMMEAAGDVIATFWNNADQFDTRIGFHPSIRNFAYLDGKRAFLRHLPAADPLQPRGNGQDAAPVLGQGADALGRAVPANQGHGNSRRMVLGPRNAGGLGGVGLPPTPQRRPNLS